MTAHIHRRDRCRACGGTGMERVLHLPGTPLSDGFVEPHLAGSEFLADLDLYRCRDCSTVQTQHDVDVRDYYRDYRYTVSSSRFARRFMQRLALETWLRHDMRPDDAVIEVGSGDGYQLACFERLGARVLGFEPSAALVEMSESIRVPVLQRLFGADTAAEIPAAMRPAQAVLLTYTFDHLPDPLPFLEAVASVLDPQRGVLVIEVHDLARIVDRVEACLFSHEHSIYLTVRTMRRLLAQAGMRLLATEIVPAHERRANSLLVTAALEGSVHTGTVTDEPGADALDGGAVYAGLGDTVRESYGRVAAHVRRARAEGRRTAFYGAGGRGVATLSLAGLRGDDVAYVCDRNHDLHGLLTPGTHVPVVSPEQLVTDPVDELVVCSFGYIDEIRAQNPEFTARGGGIVSLLDLLSADGLRAAA
jgi:SAM-dependent methyltransferase